MFVLDVFPKDFRIALWPVLPLAQGYTADPLAIRRQQDSMAISCHHRRPLPLWPLLARLREPGKRGHRRGGASGSGCLPPPYPNDCKPALGWESLDVLDDSSKRDNGINHRRRQRISNNTLHGATADWAGEFSFITWGLVACFCYFSRVGRVKGHWGERRVVVHGWKWRCFVAHSCSTFVNEETVR